MKTSLLSLLAASALLASVSPTLAQSTPAEIADHEQALRATAGEAPRRAPPLDPATVATTAPAIVAPAVVAAPVAARGRPYDSLIATHAASNGIPPELVHRVVMRESRYRASAMGRGGASGLMQIKLSTARAMGYSGSAAGLLEPNTNLTYGVRYLAGAYRAARGHHGRAVGYYASGYRGAGRPASAYARMAPGPSPAMMTADASTEPVMAVTHEVRRKTKRR